jgi:hypothetical protein
MKIGDVVRNKQSGYYWIVKYVSHWETEIRPTPLKWGLKTGKGHTTANNYNLEVIPKNQLDKLINEKEIEKMEKLYEFTVNGNTVYGTKLAVNADGLWVMDVRGGQPAAVDKSSCKEVIPYSVRVRNLSDGSLHDAMCDKDLVVEGGVYVAKTGGIYTVVKVDTEIKTSKTFEPISKLVTEAM